MGQVHGVHPECERARNAQEDYTASESAALVAVNLLSSARVVFKLDDEYTSYSAQFLVDNARVKKEGGQGELDDLSVIDALKYALKEGIPKHEHWGHLGCVFEPPPFACYMPRVPMRGHVIETEDVGEAVEMLMISPIGARLHVFTPEIDTVGDRGMYIGSASDGSSYVGLRDVVVTGVGENRVDRVDRFLEVQICYKKKTSFVRVSLSRTCLPTPLNGDSSQAIEPTGLLVNFCAPRFFT